MTEKRFEGQSRLSSVSATKRWRRTRSETHDVESHALDVIQLAGESLVGPSTVTPARDEIWRVSHEDESGRTNRRGMGSTHMAETSQGWVVDPSLVANLSVKTYTFNARSSVSVPRLHNCRCITSQRSRD
jgi:hypothetical protein